MNIQSKAALKPTKIGRCPSGTTSPTQSANCCIASAGGSPIVARMSSDSLLTSSASWVDRLSSGLSST